MVNSVGHRFLRVCPDILKVCGVQIHAQWFLKYPNMALETIPHKHMHLLSDKSPVASTMYCVIPKDIPQMFNDNARAFMTPEHVFGLY